MRRRKRHRRAENAREAFTERTKEAFEAAVKELYSEKTGRAAFVVHGGSIMAILSSYGDPAGSFYDWRAENGCGFLVHLDEAAWQAGEKKLQRTSGAFRKMKTIVFALGIGFVLDALFGDPHWLPHPVVLIGKWISFLEKQLRRLFPKTPGGERAGGTVLVLLVLLASAAVPWGILWLAGLVHPYLRFAVECFMCYQILAARSLKTESMRVYRRKLQEGNLGGIQKGGLLDRGTGSREPDHGRRFQGGGGDRGGKDFCTVRSRPCFIWRLEDRCWAFFIRQSMPWIP